MVMCSMVAVSLLCVLVAGMGIWIVWLTREKASLLKMLHTDELTGVKTRRAFFQTVMKRYKTSVAGVEHRLVFVDMDSLKLLNSAGGHRAGDQALREIGAALNNFCFKGEYVGRYGGDEFLLMLADGELSVEHRLGVLNQSLDLSHRFTWAHSRFQADADLETQVNALSLLVLNQKQEQTRYFSDSF